MKVEWFKDCKSEEEKDERRDLVKSASPTLEVLRMIVERRLREVDEQRKTRKLYEMPNWSLMQADLTGQERQLDELLDLLTIED